MSPRREREEERKGQERKGFFFHSNGNGVSGFGNPLLNNVVSLLQLYVLTDIVFPHPKIHLPLLDG